MLHKFSKTAQQKKSQEVFRMPEHRRITKHQNYSIKWADCNTSCHFHLNLIFLLGSVDCRRIKYDSNNRKPSQLNFTILHDAN